MSVQLSQEIAVQFTTQNINGSAVDATVTPIGVVVRNGDDTAIVVTVTNIETGVYKAAFTIPADWSLQDTTELRVAATVDGVAAKQVVWSDQIEAVARAGAGSATAVLTIKDISSVPVADCEVWVSRDAAGALLAAGTQETDSDGKVTFYLDPGTYYRWAQKTGKNFDNPQTFMVT